MFVKIITALSERPMLFPVFQWPWSSESDTYERVKNTKAMPARIVRMYWQYLVRYPRQLTISLVAMPILVLVQNGVLPMIYSAIIDRLHKTNGNGHLAHLNLWIAGFLSMHLLVFACQRLSNWQWSRLEHSVIKDMERSIFHTLLHQSTHFHATTHAGGLVAQAKRFTGAFSTLMAGFYGNAFALALRLLVAFGCMLYIAPSLALVLLVWTTVYVGSIYWLTQQKMHASEAAAVADSDMTAHLADTLANTSAVKLFANESFEIESYTKLSTRKYEVRRKDWRLSEIIFAWQSLLMIVLEVSVLGLSIRLVQNQTVSLGKLALIQFFLAPIMASLWQIANVFRQVETAFSEATEMAAVLELTPSVQDPVAPRQAQITKGDITFRNVNFSYRDGNVERYLFRDFNLHIQPGQHVGLVGPSGSGKSSLTKLLLRLSDIESGDITVDGQSINALRQADLRRNIAFVPQEPQLFHRTIADNIRYAKPDATQAEIEEVARRAQAHDFIMRMPEGYDTMVGERGSKLSGGERQRIAIARALLKDAPIVVLDEATSALDSESEKKIQQAFDTLIEGRTAIVIAHRLSTIQDMDRVVVLNNGQVREDDTHEALLEQGGIYAGLWAHQSGAA